MNSYSALLEKIETSEAEHNLFWDCWDIGQLGRIVRAYIVIDWTCMACIVMTCIGRAYIVMIYIVVVCLITQDFLLCAEPPLDPLSIECTEGAGTFPLKPTLAP